MEQVWKCACLNNYPVKLPDDEKGGERYECGYCLFKWRYIEIIQRHCLICDVPLKNDRCNLCAVIYDKEPQKMLVYW